MGREIKFRVWSEEDREYRTDCRLTELFTSETGTPATVYSDEGDRFDIEQYTGLKDKNGKEIYEGDIVAQELIDDPFAGGYPTYIVCWDEKFLGWALKDTTGDDGNDTDLHFFIAERRKCEIVGNIHENPELLEVKND